MFGGWIMVIEKEKLLEQGHLFLKDLQ